jgi:hypothetical protein
MKLDFCVSHNYTQRDLLLKCPFSIRNEVLPDVNSQLRGYNDDVDVFSQVISPVT